MPGLKERLERVAGQMNAFLLIIALGLAIIDLTCFWALTIEKELGPPEGVSAAALSSSAHPAAQARN